MQSKLFKRCRGYHLYQYHICKASNRWSCVRYGSTIAWNYNNNGFSNNNNFYNGLTVCPVTKLENMELYELYKSYKKSRRGKRRSADQVQFELNQFARLSLLCDKLNRHIYAPSSNYCFIHKRDKSREVWASEVELKIIQTILDDKIRPYIERELTDRTFNNRVGMGTHAAINSVMEDIVIATNVETHEERIARLEKENMELKQRIVILEGGNYA